MSVSPFRVRTAARAVMWSAGSHAAVPRDLRVRTVRRMSMNVRHRRARRRALRSVSTVSTLLRVSAKPDIRAHSARPTSMSAPLRRVWRRIPFSVTTELTAFAVFAIRRTAGPSVRLSSTRMHALRQHCTHPTHRSHSAAPPLLSSSSTRTFWLRSHRPLSLTCDCLSAFPFCSGRSVLFGSVLFGSVRVLCCAVLCSVLCFWLVVASHPISCASAPCANGAECIELGASYTCACADGFWGVHCETEIDECDSQPCAHGGSCSDGVASFTCACPAGYSGAACQTEINGKACAVQRCAALCSACAVLCSAVQRCAVHVPCSAVLCMCCAVLTHALSVSVSLSLSHSLCAECTSAPCRHGGSCVDALDSYTCLCADGFTGTHCATDIDGAYTSAVHTADDCAAHCDALPPAQCSA
jgi:hypothetical protein